jgi:hypothetical protein
MNLVAYNKRKNIFKGDSVFIKNVQRSADVSCICYHTLMKGQVLRH